MEKLLEFLETLRKHGLVAGHLRGVFHIVIGRRITDRNGRVVSAGVTWRELSNILKDMRFDKDLVVEIGAVPDELSPRDRQRFWYSVIALAKPDSTEAHTQAAKLIAALKPHGYTIGSAPAPPSQKSLSTPSPQATDPVQNEAGKSKKKKKNPQSP